MSTFLPALKRYLTPKSSRPPKDEPAQPSNAVSAARRSYTPRYAGRAMAQNLPIADRPDVLARRRSSVCAAMGLNPVVNDRSSAHFNALLSNAANHTERLAVGQQRVPDSPASRALAAHRLSVDLGYLTTSDEQAESSAAAAFRGQMAHDEEARRRMRENMRAAGSGKSYSSSTGLSRRRSACRPHFSSTTSRPLSLSFNNSAQVKRSKSAQTLVTTPPPPESLTLGRATRGSRVHFEDEIKHVASACAPEEAPTGQRDRHDSKQSSDHDSEVEMQRAMTLAQLEGGAAEQQRAQTLAQLEGFAAKSGDFPSLNPNLASTLGKSRMRQRAEAPIQTEFQSFMDEEFARLSKSG